MHCDFTQHKRQSADGNYPDWEFTRYEGDLYLHEVEPRHTNDGMLVIEVPDLIPFEPEGPNDG